MVATSDDKKKKKDVVLSREAAIQLASLRKRYGSERFGEAFSQQRDNQTLGYISKNGKVVHDEEAVRLNDILRKAKSIVRGKKSADKSRVEKITLTNFGKFRTTYTTPSSRDWEKLDSRERERMAEYTLNATTRYLESAQHYIKGEKYPRRLKLAEVRTMQLPMIRAGINMLAETIVDQSKTLRGMRREGDNAGIIQTQQRLLEGLVRRMKILQGVAEGVESGTFTTLARNAERSRRKKTRPQVEEKAPEARDTEPERKAPTSTALTIIPTKPLHERLGYRPPARVEIAYPGATALRRSTLRISPSFDRDLLQRRERLRAPQERQLPPHEETDERSFDRKRREANTRAGKTFAPPLKELSEIDRRRIATIRVKLRPFPRATEVFEQFLLGERTAEETTAIFNRSVERGVRLPQVSTEIGILERMLPSDLERRAQVLRDGPRKIEFRRTFNTYEHVFDLPPVKPTGLKRAAASLKTGAQRTVNTFGELRKAWQKYRANRRR